MKRADIRRQNTSVLIINASRLLRVKSKIQTPPPPPFPSSRRDNVVRVKKERKERDRRGEGGRAKKGRSLSKQSAGTVQLLISARLCRNKKDRLDSSAMTQLYECTSKSVRLASPPNLHPTIFLSPRRRLADLATFHFLYGISVPFVTDVPNFRTLFEGGREGKKGGGNVVYENKATLISRRGLSLSRGEKFYLSIFLSFSLDFLDRWSSFIILERRIN